MYRQTQACGCQCVDSACTPRQGVLLPVRLSVRKSGALCGHAARETVLAACEGWPERHRRHRYVCVAHLRSRGGRVLWLATPASARASYSARKTQEGCGTLCVWDFVCILAEPLPHHDLRSIMRGERHVPVSRTTELCRACSQAMRRLRCARSQQQIAKGVGRAAVITRLSRQRCRI